MVLVPLKAHARLPRSQVPTLLAWAPSTQGALFLAGCVAPGGFLQLHQAGLPLVSVLGHFTAALRLQSSGPRLSGFSSRSSQMVKCRLSSCGPSAQVPCGMWNPPGPGIELTSPALVGGFLTTGSPGKSSRSFRKETFPSFYK